MSKYISQCLMTNPNTSSIGIIGFGLSLQHYFIYQTPALQGFENRWSNQECLNYFIALIVRQWAAQFLYNLIDSELLVYNTP